MKKALIKTIFCIIFVFVFCFVSNPVLAKPIKIVLGSFEPEMTAWSQVMKAWGTELEKVTKGQVKADYSFGGTIVKPGETYDLVRRGIIDAGPCVAAFGGPGQFPMIDAIGLPYNIPTALIGGRTIFKYAEKGFLDKEFTEVMTVSFMTGQGDTLYTKDKPVTSLDDVKGLKLAATTPVVQQRVKLWGGTPVTLPFTELYSGLKKGIIDGILLNYHVHAIFNLAEVLKYTTLPGTGGVATVFILNKKTFKKLPPEGQKFVEDTRLKYTDMFNGGWDKSCEMGRNLFFKKGGKELQWSPDALEKRAKLEGPMWEKWIADKKDAGLPGREAVNFIYKSLKDQGVDPVAVGYKP